MYPKADFYGLNCASPVNCVRALLLGTAVLVPALALPVCAQEMTVFRTPEASPQAQLTQYLNRIALKQLRSRTHELSLVRTREEMDHRKKIVRQKIIRMLGDLPSYHGPLNTKQVGTLDRRDYRIEKVIYESLPRFYVTADVYLPASGAGPFPAILMPAGHFQGGKEGDRERAVSLARKGFVVLKYDPIGQGERVQYYDPELETSKIGVPTLEHSHLNGHTMLIGDNVARYQIWDGIRGIDYLVSRKDVDANRIGCTGGSGGGTLTTYISALDERVKVAIPAAYITSWEELMVTLGPQDAEQCFPGFLKEGLNIADYIELIAPRPCLILSTIEDMFPLEGARQTFEEAKRIYALYGAEDKIGWYIGPGPHSIPQPSREASYAWFIKYLKNGQGNPAEAPLELDPPEYLWCTRTGHVADSLGGETVFSLNRKRAAELMPNKPVIDSTFDVARLSARLANDIRSLAAVNVQPGGPPPLLKIHQTIERERYRINVVSIDPERGIHLAGLLMVPEGQGTKPAVIAADPRSKEMSAAVGGDMESLVLAGYLVFIVQPRGLPETAEVWGPRTVLRDQQAESRADLVGKTLVGMRTEDIIRAVDYLCSRGDVDHSRIVGYGQGAAGVPMLHAAVLDKRISQLVLDETLAAYQLAIDQPLHRNLYKVAIPGVLTRYDLDELLVALTPRDVTVLRPIDAVGQPMTLAKYRKVCWYALEADEKTGQRGRIKVVEWGRGGDLRSYIR